MREIKFRGRRKNSSEWVYGAFLAIPKLCSYIYDVQPDGQATRYLVDEDTVGQFTGLFDRNGKEIYEGDIIEVNSGCCVKDGGRTDFIFHSVVFWYKSGFKYRGPGLFSDSFDNVKVIGNVHDDPEMLEATHD